MLGSIIGDIVGSIYEFDNIKTKDFPLFGAGAEYTDDSVLTVATAHWLLHGGTPAAAYLDHYVRYPFPMGSYGGGFSAWAHAAAHGAPAKPYGSQGNGSAMRVGPVGWAFATAEETLDAAKTSAACTHNHPEGVKGAQTTALAIFMARGGAKPAEIKTAIETEFGYDLSMTVDEIRPRYSWHGLDGKGNGGICPDSVPQAICCALQAENFEDAVRNAISIGGDSDTIGAIAGSIAEALFGIPGDLRRQGMAALPDDLAATVREFEDKFGAR